jgi:hypothetical protein
MSLQANGQDCLDFFSDRPLVIEPSRALLRVGQCRVPVAKWWNDAAQQFYGEGHE